MDTTQTNPNANYFTSGATFDTSKPIPVSGLTTSPTPVSTPPVPTLSTPENLANFSVADLTATPSPTATETKKSGVMSSIGDLYSKYFNKGAEQQAMETQAGLPEKNKALTDAINAFRTTTMEQNQLLQEQGAIPLALQEQAQGRGITAGGLAPIQAGELRKNAIKQYQVTSKGLFQQAMIANLRDDIAGATANIEKAISYKYAPIEQEIKYLTDVVLPDLRDTLNKEDKKREQDLQIKINEKNRLLENAKEDSKAGANLALTAMNNFPNDRQAQLNAQLAMQEAQKEQPDLNKIFQLVGQYQKDPIATQKALAELTQARLQNEKIITDINLLKNPTGLVSSNGKPLTDAQATALGYANRIAQASQTLDTLGKQFAGANVQNVFGGYVPNILKSSDRQQYEQAQQNFVNAVLRKESGAAIAQSEFDNAKKQYFPQPGDSDAVIAQKKANRDLVYNNFLISAGSPKTKDGQPLGVQQTTVPTVISNGQQFIVGQVYEDKNGKWKIDANGNWTKI